MLKKCIPPLMVRGIIGIVYNHASFVTSASLCRNRKHSNLTCPFCERSFRESNLLTYHLSSVHALPMTEKLMEDPLKTYAGIFGPSTGIKDGLMQFPNDISVHIEGPDKGLWKKNRDDIWQDPLQAIQMEMGSSLNQAIQFAMNLSGITKEELCQLKSSQNQTMAGGIDSREKKLLEIKLKVQTAKAIWNASECIKGTIAETYLLQHRGISPETIPRLEFRYLPDKKQYRDSIRGELMADAALVVAALNMAGELTGIQRVFLDPNGDKSKRSSYSKKVKGVVKGSLCYVQRGKPNGLVYVVEGPETGAAIATVAGPDVTVVASLSASLLKETVPNVIALNPSEVVLAIDYDISEMAQEEASEALTKYKKELARRNIKFKMVCPNPMTSKEDQEKIEDIDWTKALASDGISIGEILFRDKEASNVDWNDILLKHGAEELKHQLGIEAENG